MTQTIQQEHYLWIKPLIQKKFTYVDVLKSTRIQNVAWNAGIVYKRGGIAALPPLSTEPKTQQTATSITVKEQVIIMYKETGLCIRR